MCFVRTMVSPLLLYCMQDFQGVCVCVCMMCVCVCVMCVCVCHVYDAYDVCV